MKLDEKKMMFSEKLESEVKTAFSEAVDRFMDPDKMLPNVVGLGYGTKWSKGEPTGEPALIVLVSQKIEKEQLTKAELAPGKLADMQTDVLAIGVPMAEMPGSSEAGTEALKRRIRPAKGGYSVGHKDITAGTIGTCVYDVLPQGSISPPKHGIGVPSRYYILSNNHVLANVNEARTGDAILQPGPYDGGTDPRDRIASLSRFIPITLDPPVDVRKHRNYVDAAIADADFEDIDRAIYWIGHVRGWRRKAAIKPGMVVQKTGRTTSYTIGRITTINATVDVGYGGGRVGRFLEQIITTDMSAGGDSGSLVTTPDNVAVGLLFAGSSTATICNYIESVRAQLRIEVGEEIL